MSFRNKLIAWRRHLHANPELSFQEYKTSQYLAQELKILGVSVEYLQPTGIIGVITGNKPGATVALRADMDALALQDVKDVSYKSQVPGVMHACGHDGHCAILLGAAESLMAQADNLAGKVMLIFQPAEEAPPGGAKSIIERGVLKDVDWIFGLHLWNGIPEGLVGLSAGPVMANSDKFLIEIQGKGGHGSMPHVTVDALLVAAQVVTALQSIVSRTIDPLESAAVSVGSFNSGTAFNIIPQTAVIKGTYRSFSGPIRALIEQKIKQIAEGSCAAFGAACRVECTRGYPVLINPQTGVDLMRKAAVKVVGEQQVIMPPPFLSGEDFALFLQQIPGAFMFLGSGGDNPVPHHHPAFDFSEAVLETGVEILVQTVLEALNN